jgi:hypothetical protein
MFRQCRAVADLHGQPRRRPVQHGLAVEPDDGNGGLVDMLSTEKCLHRLRMNAGHEGIRFGEYARPRRAIGQARAFL